MNIETEKLLLILNCLAATYPINNDVAQQRAKILKEYDIADLRGGLRKNESNKKAKNLC